MKRPSSLLKIALGSILAIFMLSLGLPSANQYINALPGGAYVYPIMSARLSSKIGKRKHPIYKVSKHHKGIDLAAPMNSPIRAIAEGTVVFADRYKGYGNLVVIDHGDGLTSHYGHCHEINVAPLEHIAAGQIVATVGKTGNVTGPHLHLEIRKEGKAVDPQNYLPSLTVKAQG